MMESKSVLMFGRAPTKEISLDRYELPPVPSAGALDVRFATNRSVEIIPERIAAPIELPLKIQGNGDPLTLKWDMRDNSGLKYTLLEKKGSRISARHKMSSEGSAVIRPGGNMSYSLRVEEIPRQFALYQNYPNPFNPTTTVRFDLPSSSTVTLKVYNVLGQVIFTPGENDVMDEGQHSMEINANSWASGAYFYSISATSIDGKKFQSMKKMLLLK